MIRLRNTALGVVVATGLLSGCTGEELPVDPNGPLIMTLWTRELLDQNGQAVPISETHLSRARVVWSIQCRVSVHNERAGPAISIPGIDRFNRRVELGQSYWADGALYNAIQVQNQRMLAQYGTSTGQFGGNVFSSREVLIGGGQFAHGVTETGANASVVTPLA